MTEWVKNLSLETKAIFLGLIEGATEFLPVSSTGHLIIFGDVLGFDEKFAPVFDLSIQSGAILAVIWVYRSEIYKMFTKKNFLELRIIFVAFSPIALTGFLFGEMIMSSLFTPSLVAVAFILGGALILLVEKRYDKQKKTVLTNNINEIGYLQSFKIGCFQILSLIPGASRSGMVIIGGMFFGCSRYLATKFSFFLSLPVIVSAGIYSIFLSRSDLSVESAPFFFLGFASAFVSALIVIRWLISFVQNRSLRIFAYYRIVVGAIILLLNF